MIRLKQVNKHEFLQELKFRIEKEEISEEEIFLLVSSGKKQRIKKLFDAVKSESTKKFKDITKGEISDIINSIDEKGNTVLHYAVANGNEEMVKILLGIEKIDINVQNKEMRETPLHIVVKKIEEAKYKSIFKALLMKEFNPLLRNEYGYTVFHYVAEKNDWETFKELFEKTKEKIGDSFNINNIRNDFDWPVINNAAFGIVKREKTYKEDDLKIIEILLREWRKRKDNQDDNKLLIEEIFAVEELLEEKSWECVENYRNLVKEIIIKDKKWREKEFGDTYMIEISK